jgi:hypothetical protein
MNFYVGESINAAVLEHFPAKWNPVSPKKML